MQQICEFKDTDKDTIEITYDEKRLARLDFWTLYEVKMRANSNFVQGSGFSYSEGSVYVMWVNLTTGDGFIEGSSLIERRDSNRFTVEFSGAVDAYLKLKWIITPSIPSINGEKLNQKQLTIPANTLEAGSQYTFEAQLFFIKSDKDPISNAIKIVNVKKGPIGGRVEVSPRSGTAQVEKVHIKAPGWYIENNP